MSVVCIAFILIDLDVNTFRDAFYRVQFLSFFWSTILVILMSFIKGWRVWPMLNYQASLMTSMTSLFIGEFTNMVLPLRLGELIRVGILKEKDDIPVATSLPMVFLSQIFDIACILLIGVGLLLSNPQLQEFMPLVAGLVVMTSVVLLGLGLLARASQLSTFLSYHRVQAIFQQVIDGLRILQSAEKLIIPLLLTLIYWVGLTFSTWILLGGLIDNPTWGMAFAATFAGGIGRAIPALPGSIGTVDFSILLALQTYGVAHDEALVLVILIRARYMIHTIIVGLLALFYENLSMRDVIQVEESMQGETPMNDFASEE